MGTESKLVSFCKKFGFIILDIMILAFIFQLSYVIHRSVAFVVLLVVLEFCSKTKLATRIVERFDLSLFLISTALATLPLFFYYRFVFTEMPDFVFKYAVPILIIDGLFFAVLIFFGLSFVIKDKKANSKKYLKSLVAGM